MHSLTLICEQQDAEYKLLRKTYESLIGSYGGFSSLDISDSSYEACQELCSALEKLAQAGYAPAYAPLSMGFRLLDDEKQAQYWVQKAVEWLEKQTDASAEDLLSYADYALLFIAGFGVEKNPERAVYWFQKAAEQGNARSQYCLGEGYAKGEGVEKNPDRAAYWLEKAAEQGEGGYQDSLSERYAKGEGVEKNPERAAYWNKRAFDSHKAYAAQRVTNEKHWF